MECIKWLRDILKTVKSIIRFIIVFAEVLYFDNNKEFIAVVAKVRIIQED